MPTPGFKIARRLRSPRGFALLITVTLLAFLVLLLVSLAALTRVETQVATNSRQLSLARQNALLALNIALGQLQKFAGPDQRITTTADFVADTDKTGIASPPSLIPAIVSRVTVQPGSRYWTGVWGNGQSAIGYDQAPDALSGDGTTPVLLNWLVSGNEATAFTTAGTQGGVTAGSAPAYTPATAVASGITLVGTQSAGATADTVTAPLVPVQIPTASLAGADPANGPLTTTGNYAWWVGDEGVKARINLQNGYQKTGQTSDQLNSFLLAQRDAVEFMDFDNTAPAAPALPAANDIGAAAYNFNSTAIPSLWSPGQLPLLAANAAARTTLASAARYRFHDLSAWSGGVLADSYAGGLKKDLTADLADTADSSSAGYRPADNAPIFTPLSSTEANLPTWGHLRSWARTRTVVESNQNVLKPVPPSDTAAGVYPAVQYLSLGFNHYLDGDVFKMAFFPLVVLHNPYPHPIAATDYDFGLRFGATPQSAAAQQGYPRLVLEIAGEGETHYEPVATVGFDTLSIVPAGAAFAGTDYFRLKIQGDVIPPGESHVYLLTDESAPAYSPGSIVLKRASVSDDDEWLNFFTITGPALSPLTTKFIPDKSRLRLRDDNLYGGSRSEVDLSFALAEKNTLPSSWNLAAATRAHWYQAALGIRMMRRATVSPAGVDPDGNGPLKPPYTPNRVYLLATLASEGDLIDSRQTPPSEAGGSFRFACPYSSNGNGGWWTSNYRAGIQHQHVVRFLAAGNMRPAVIQATAVENDYTTNSDVETGAPPYGVVYSGMVAENSRTQHPTLQYKKGVAGFGDSPDIGTVPNHGLLFDLLDSPDRLLSLGQLQHAPFARYSFSPSYPFANSYADIRILRPNTYRADLVVPPGGAASAKEPVYDLSWHLNRALWDRYFVSGVPASLTQAALDAGDTPLPDARLRPIPGNAGAPPAVSDLRYDGSGANAAYDRAAAHLLVAGGFNINSTSEQAWRAVLGGTSGLPSDPSYASSGDNVAAAIPFPRFARNLARSASGSYPAITQTMTEDTASYGTRRYHRNRGLFFNAPAIAAQPSREAVLAELARSIVTEIRRRGPFLSLADFVNRPLTASAELAGVKGALQAAIDGASAAATINVGSSSQVSAISSVIYDWDIDHFAGGDHNVSGVPSRTRWALAPSFLSQADLLSTLGPRLGARSDTFVIRTYGETINPVTQTRDGRAWCEAVVQRLPDYVGGESPETAPSALPSASPSRAFGRSFKIVSFRWLSPQDL